MKGRRLRTNFWLNFQFSKEKKLSHLYKNFVPVSVLEILLPSLNEGKISKFSWDCNSSPLNSPFVSWANQNYSTMPHFWLNYLQHAIFSKSLIKADFFLLLGETDKCGWRLHYIPYLSSLGFVQFLT